MKIRGHYDVIVVGGGTAGAIAGISAAKTGAKTLLIEQYGSLGGVITLGMSFKGINDGEGYKALGGIGEEIFNEARLIDGATAVSYDPRHGSIMGQDPETIKMIILRLSQEVGLDLLLHTFLVDVLIANKKVQGVIVANKKGLEIITADVFVDCTGDADLVERAGGRFIKGRESDALMQPVSSIYRVGGVKLEKTLKYLEENPEDLEKPEGPFRDEYTIEFIRKTPGAGIEGFRKIIEKARAAGDFHFSRDVLGINPMPERDVVTINVSRIHGIDGTDPDDITRAEVESQLQMFETVRFLKKYIPGFEKSYVVSSPYQVGIRETRHIWGSYVLTKEDVLSGRDFEDQIGRGAYPLDIHDLKEDTVVLGNEVKGNGVTLWRINRSYGIPARCLIPLDVENITVSGRSISATHEAAGSVRGQSVCMVTGHAAGTMAALSALQCCNPAQLDIELLQSTLLKQSAVLERS